MAYLFLMHTIRILTIDQDKTIKKRLLKSFFSFSLIISFIAWAFAFFLFEPALWYGVRSGIRNILAYLKVTAEYGTPENLLRSSFPHLIIFNLTKIPHNASILIKSINPYFALLAFFGLLASLKRFYFNTIKIAFLPLLFTGILFLTKPLLAGEYLLHPIPYIYIFTGIGCITFFYSKKRRYIKTLLGILFLSLTIFYGLYIGLSEANYFSLGNVTLYTRDWVKKNLNGQNFRIKKHVIMTQPHKPVPSGTCNVFIVNGRSYVKTKNDILLKRFQIEKEKPLLYHLRPQRIDVFAKKGKDFTGVPKVPACPVPLLPLKKTLFTRFLNGVNFNPSYNTFFLAPRKIYAWTIFSKHEVKFFKCIVQNGYATNHIRMGDKTYSFLPFEKKTVKIPLKKLFPWKSPFRYNFTVKPHWETILEFPAAITPNNIKSIKTTNFRAPIDDNRSKIKRLFKQLFNYDFRYLSSQITREVPVIGQKVFTTVGQDILVKKYQTPWHTPIFLKKGSYKLKIPGMICFTGKGRIQIAVVTADRRYLLKKTFSKEELDLSYKTKSPNFYHIQLRFRTRRDVFVSFVIKSSANTCINLKAVFFKTDYLKMLKNEVNNRLIDDYIRSTNIAGCLSLYEKLDPEDLNSNESSRLAEIFYKNGKLSLAKYWYEIAQTKNPIDKSYVKKLITIYKALGNFKKVYKYSKLLDTLKSIRFTDDACFETGYALIGFILPEKFSTTEPIHIKLFLKLPNISAEQCVFLSFEKDGNFYFGKDFGLDTAEKFGEIYKISGSIHVPKKIPQGIYKAFFTFRIPKTNYRYENFVKGKASNKRRVFLEQLEQLTIPVRTIFY